MNDRIKTVMTLKNDVEKAVSLMLQAEKILKKSQNKNFRTAAVLLRQSCSFVNKHKEIKIGQLLMTGSPEEKKPTDTMFGDQPWP